MKILLALPVESRTLTHAARMVCKELVLAVSDVSAKYRFEVLAPYDLAESFEGINISTLPKTASGWQRLHHEQILLPRIAQNLGADLLLMPFEAGPLGTRVPLVLFEAIDGGISGSGIVGHLLQATRKAGAEGAIRRVMYSDMIEPVPAAKNISVIDPWVHTNFRALSKREDRQIAEHYGLPGHYVLAHGVSPADIRLLLASWTWVDGSVGDTVALAAIVADGLEKEVWEVELQRLELGHSVRLVAGVRFNDLPSLYRRAEALLQGGLGLEHQIMRWAMSCGIPVIGFEAPTASRVLGPAGYLVAPGDTRALGAACLTVIVESDIRGRLRREGLSRASIFHSSESPVEVLNQIAGNLSG
jgi:hypothetical protein